MCSLLLLRMCVCRCVFVCLRICVCMVLCVRVVWLACVILYLRLLFFRDCMFESLSVYVFVRRRYLGLYVCVCVAFLF